MMKYDISLSEKGVNLVKFLSVSQKMDSIRDIRDINRTLVCIFRMSEISIVLIGDNLSHSTLVGSLERYIYFLKE